MRIMLFVNGQSGSRKAEENLRAALEGTFEEPVDIVVVDIRTDHAALEEHNVLAVPTLLRNEPPPAKRLIGDMSDPQRVADVLKS